MTAVHTRPSLPAAAPGPQPRRERSTPARFRMWSIVTTAAIAVLGLLLFLAAQSLADSSRRIEQNSAPVLVSTQDLLASVAEAETTSSAVFLGGADGDIEQRRLYLTARDRSARQVDEIARRIGDDDAAHTSLQSVAAELSSNAGLVEEARSRNLLGDPDAGIPLEASIDAVGQRILPEVDRLAESAQQNFDDDVNSSSVLFWLAVIMSVVVILLILRGMQMLSRATNRTLNLPLLLAEVLIVAALLWTVSGFVNQRSILDQARDDALSSITLTADIQRNAFSYKTAETAAVIEGTETDRSERASFARLLSEQDLTAADAGSGGDGRIGVGLLFNAQILADNNRESAAVTEMITRWSRYLAQSEQIEALIASGDIAQAREIAIGPGNDAFIGFNASVESVLSDNRAQFLDAAGEARDAVWGMRLVAILLPLLASIAALWGYQMRIAEYR